MNELLLFVEIVLAFGSIVALYKLFGKSALFAWVGIASVIANIAVAKNVDMIGVHATLGNVMFATVFFCTCIIEEKHSKAEAYKAVKISICCIVVWIVASQLILLFQPNNIDVADSAMQDLFALSMRISIASAVMFFLANIANVWFFGWLKKKFGDRVLWLRGNVSMIVCNCLENFFFVFAAFLGVYTVGDCLINALSTCAIELIVTVCSTPFLYLAKRIKPLEK